MKSYFFILASFVLIFCGCAGLHSAAAITTEMDIVYGKGYMAEAETETPRLQPLHLDVYRPDTLRPSRAAVILIHGGSFEHGSRKHGRMVTIAETLAARDYVCFIINYRLVRNHPPAPPPHIDVLSRTVHAAIVDTRTAMRYVRAHAKTYGIDPERIALLGTSAGAITALGAGLAQDNSFDSDGPDFPVPEINHPEVEVQAAAIVNLWGSLDFLPELFGPHAPPIMTVHGDRDFTVGISLLPAEHIDALSKEHGTVHQYHPIQDAGHGLWDIVIDGQPLAEAIADFLDRHVQPG